MSSGVTNGKHYTNNINRCVIIISAVIALALSASAPLVPPKESWVIVIDPGHGGRDPGAVGSFSFEKNITLAVALKTGAYLEQHLKNVKVIYTRKTDVFMGLNERAEMANRSNADLFISIHANAHPLRSTYGTETYVMGHSMDKQNLEVAMKENEVIMLEGDYSTTYEGFDPKSPESYIMFTLMQNAFSEQSLNLAAMVQNEYKTRVGRYDRGVKQAGFWVLWKTTMPSILTEIGFITHSNEEKYINSSQGQEYLASALYRACRDYIAEIDRKSNISTSKTDAPDLPAADITAVSPGEIVFMVQVSASTRKTEIRPENFRQISDVVELYTPGRYRYATGSFRDYSKAVEYRKQVEKIYPDAFVIAVKDNKILPLQEALDSVKRGK